MNFFAISTLYFDKATIYPASMPIQPAHNAIHNKHTDETCHKHAEQTNYKQLPVSQRLRKKYVNAVFYPHVIQVDDHTHFSQPRKHLAGK